PADDVEQLRELVQALSTEESPDLGDPRVGGTGERPAGSTPVRGLCSHRAELEHPEGNPRSSHPWNCNGGTSAILPTDDDSEDADQRGEDYCQGCGDDPISAHPEPEPLAHRSRAVCTASQMRSTWSVRIVEDR